VTMRIFSGIQPTGEKHFGNYSGGFRQYAATQELGDAVFCIVDLHSITVEYEPDDLRERSLDLAAMLFATGIDPERSTVFCQSHVPAHAEAAWLLGSVTSFGELRRMTQFKEKGDRQEFVSSALFTYPVLMAGDILLYQTDRVPIGDDQRQHLELAREIARRFNATYGEVLVEPEHVIPQVGARVMDLQETSAKMSTSFGTDAGLIYIDDAPDDIRRKLKRAQTDSGREIVRAPEKAGISNLIEIYAVAAGVEPENVERKFAGEGYGSFKSAVGEAVVALLAPVRERYRELRADEAGLERTLAEGADRARAIASPTIGEVHRVMGLSSAVGRRV